MERKYHSGGKFHFFFHKNTGRQQSNSLHWAGKHCQQFIWCLPYFSSNKHVCRGSSSCCHEHQPGGSKHPMPGQPGEGGAHVWIQTGPFLTLRRSYATSWTRTDTLTSGVHTSRPAANQEAGLGRPTPPRFHSSSHCSRSAGQRRDSEGVLDYLPAGATHTSSTVGINEATAEQQWGV